MEVSVSELNGKRWIPVKNYDTDAIDSGLLQVPRRSYVVLDETRLDSGRANVANLRALQSLVRDQKVCVQFGPTQIELPIETNVLTLSVSRSVAEIVWLFDRGTREATEAARSLAEGLVGTVDSTLRNEAVELGRVGSIADIKDHIGDGKLWHRFYEDPAYKCPVRASQRAFDLFQAFVASSSQISSTTQIGFPARVKLIDATGMIPHSLASSPNSVEQAEMFAWQNEMTKSDAELAYQILRCSSLPLLSDTLPHRVATSAKFAALKQTRVPVSDRKPPQVCTLSVSTSSTSPSLSTGITAMTCSSDASVIGAACEAGNKVLLWNLDAKSDLPSAPGEPPTSEVAAHTLVSQDLRFVSSVYKHLYYDNSDPASLDGHTSKISVPVGGGVSAIDLAPDCPLLAVGTRKGQLSLWSIEKLCKIVAYSGYGSTNPLWALKWSPLSYYMCTTAPSANLSGVDCRLWRTDVPVCLRVLVEDTHGKRLSCGFNQMCWHPSGQMVAVAQGEVIQLWDVATPRCARKLFLPPGAGLVLSMEFSHGGEQLAAGTSAGRLLCWDLRKTGQRLCNHPTGSPVTCLTWSWPVAGMSHGLDGMPVPPQYGYEQLVSADDTGK
ncbi:hypothetical protein Pmar_PMAR029328 [Perkinsus marinus ATCC 50983]|uniref:Uncharacterized protein n=1 Tax=Perkinsus marinus (strain ATCC 50983 / TXsc) TaxID=423536 RepID=C5KMV0_PERM5|nr:hypothetical protein Pmar_PMAR029328 [Perkinsus marinus ATCC 50983]EER14258.1 hypothetical protein Pmar_PMAR029328 [Perkinsus marinus ATCC 50983]|eukprot:XP_002782463.1 hypothetical protein Pmar_PMAR029328 [Perkinsus marinus ATCC 50983]